jgi:O6-methylguanine-DNA--protein-cysteine methyltransferase
VRRKAGKIFKTPLGWAGVAVSEKGICRIVLPRNNRQDVQNELEDHSCANRPPRTNKPPQSPFSKGGGGKISPLTKGGTGGFEQACLHKAVKLLRHYFSGKCVSFDLPLDLGYYTGFQRAVWKACTSIPFGETRSYGSIAKQIGRPRAVRAVGQAMGANPIPVIIP